MITRLSHLLPNYIQIIRKPKCVVYSPTLLQPEPKISIREQVFQLTRIEFPIGINTINVWEIIRCHLSKAGIMQDGAKILDLSPLVVETSKVFLVCHCASNWVLTVEDLVVSQIKNEFLFIRLVSLFYLFHIFLFFPQSGQPLFYSFIFLFGSVVNSKIKNLTWIFLNEIIFSFHCVSCVQFFWV